MLHPANHLADAMESAGTPRDYQQIEGPDDDQCFIKCSKRWTNISRSATPSGREGHVAQFLSDKTIVLFAGGRRGDDEDAGALNDTWLFNTEDMVWSESSPISQPPPRMWFASGAWPKHLIVFGGMGRGQVLGDCWLFMLDTLAWQPIHAQGDPPTARLAGGGVVMLNSFFTFGGSAANDAHVYCLDLASNCWSSIDSAGENPLPCRDFAVQICSQSGFVLIGGEKRGRAGRELQNTVYHASVSRRSGGEMQLEWSKLSSSGDIPSPRHAMCLAAITSTRIVAFGGVDSHVKDDAYILMLGSNRDAEHATWSQVQESGGQQPAARMHPTMICLPDVSGIGVRFLLFGGLGGKGGESKYPSDTWILDVDFLGEKLEELKDACSRKSLAAVRKAVGVVRLAFEDVLQGGFQIGFLFEFWRTLPLHSKAFTIVSVAVGLCCSIMGPINEYLTELKNRKEEAYVTDTVKRMRGDALMQENLMNTLVDCDLSSLLSGADAEDQDAEGQGGHSAPSALEGEKVALVKHDPVQHVPVGRESPETTSSHDDVMDYLTAKPTALIALLCVSTSFWAFVLTMPLWVGGRNLCEDGMPPWAKVIFASLQVTSLSLECWIATRTNRGAQYFRGGKKTIVFHLVLACLGRYDIFTDMAFVLMSHDCGYSLWTWAAMTFLVGVLALQGLPSMALFCWKKHWAMALKMNDFNVLATNIDGTAAYIGSTK